MAPLLLIHHAARRGDHPYPPNSLPALAHCLAARARVVEVDVSPLQAGDFLLAHDGMLETFTTGHGPVSALTPQQARPLRLTWRGEATPHPPALLSQALALLQEHRAPVELQLDLKEHTWLNKDVLTRLVSMVQPLRDRVRVTSCADWALRRLRALDSDLPLGFDPLFYLDKDVATRDPNAVPSRIGAYGYWDDHPLASVRWGSAADYLRERADALWAQVPPGCVWYIRARLLLRVLDDGFDWIGALHQRGVLVDAWTLDPDRPGHLEIARRLAAARVDRITSNDPPGLAAALGGEVLY